MNLRKPAIIDRLHCPAFVFFHVAAVTDTFCARWRKTFFDIAMKIWIAPRPAGIVNAHRLVRFDLAVYGFRRRQ